MAVDLDALEAELSVSIGKDKTVDVMEIIRRHVSPEPSRRAAVDTDAVIREVYEYGHDCHSAGSSGESEYESAGKRVAEYNKKAEQHLASIRAMLEPHDAARLRETIAKAAYSAWWEHEKSPDPWDKVADAVIRAIGGAR